MSNYDEGPPNTRTLQRMLGPNHPVLPLPAFLRQRVRNLPPPPSMNAEKDVAELLHNTLVAPFLEMPCLENAIGKDGIPRNAESLSSLVDHVVFSLVQRRERHQRLGKDGRNLLCQGFVVATDELARSGAQSMRNMPSGILLMQMNNTVEYIKTKPLFRFLHSWVGDNVLRTILMYCSIFIPIGNTRENYLQLSGPPMRLQSKLESSLASQGEKAETKSSRRKRKRKKNIIKSVATQDIFPSLTPSATIRKDPLLYSNAHVPRIGLPTNHVLQRCTARELLLDMTKAKVGTGTMSQKRWKRLRRRGLDVCQSILENHQKCDYARLLNHYCPLPVLSNQTDQGNCDLAVLSAAYSPTQSVASFLKSVVKRVFSGEVWGGQHNQECVMQLLHTFVHARRQEHLTNTQLLQNIRIKKMEWLRSSVEGKKFSRSDYETTQQLVLLVLRWTLEKFAIPLLSACFYVTETEFTGKQLVYYRKPVWTLFRSLSLKKLFTSQYTELTPSQAAERLETQKMGFSRLRLVPKETGVRPIALLSKSAGIAFESTAAAARGDLQVWQADDSEPPTKRRKWNPTFLSSRTTPQYMPSTNSVLSEAFAILRHEYEEDTSLFGSGLDGLHHFYPTYRKFIEKVRPRCTDKPLVLGSVDIRHCFDSINQEEMLRIVETVLKKPEYCIQVHAQYRPYESMSRLLRLKKTRVCKPEDIIPFHMAADELASSSHKTVFADMVKCSVSRNGQILSLVEEHLKSHLVATADRTGDRYLLQSQGVAQGSTLSTLLCNFYYGKIEKQLLKDVQKCRFDVPQAERLICRQVDDFLFVGTDRQLLEDFLSAMLRGDKELGVDVNEDKTQVSTTVRVHKSSETTQVLSPNGTRRKFPWCGMLFDVNTGEVMVDYTRFHSDKSGNSISVDRSRGQGEELLVQLKSFARPRCIPILYDNSINSPPVQKSNFFQMVAFAAVKMIVYIRARHISVDEKSNISFILSCMESAISYAGTLIRSRLNVAEASWDISPSDQNYIGWKAFHSVWKSYGKARAVTMALEKVPHHKADESLDRQCQRALRSMELSKLMVVTKHCSLH